MGLPVPLERALPPAATHDSVRKKRLVAREHSMWRENTRRASKCPLASLRAVEPSAPTMLFTAQTHSIVGKV